MLKKIVWIMLLGCLISSNALAQNKSDDGVQIAAAEFKSDGCSWFPDGDYLDCCVEHDTAYFKGGGWTKRWRADKRLFKCVAAKRGFQHKFIAPVMWLGVRGGGVHWLPTRFRWGFGRNQSPINRAK